MSNEKLTDISEQEFEAGVKRLVEREFARALKAMQSGEQCEIPIIGGF